MKELLAALTLLIVVLISGCKENDYQATVGVCPLVVSTLPANGAVMVPLNQLVSATFNEKMNPATITSTSFTVMSSTIISGVLTTAAVTGDVSYSEVTAFFKPTNPLLPKTTYTGRITTATRDLNGNALQTDYVWSFATDLPPTVTSDPVINATGVLLNKVIVVTFSVAMDSLTLKTPATNFTVKQGTTIIPGKFSYTDKTVTFTPTSNLLPFTVYTGTISKDVKNRLGTSMAADYVWTFTTIPQVTLSSFPVSGGTTSGAGLFAQGSSVTVSAAANAGYTFTNWTEGLNIVSTSANYLFSLTGNRTLIANYTSNTPPNNPLAIDLGCAAPFAVLAGSTITSTGPSIITGDVGLSPGSALVGFPPGIINGTQQIATPIADAAKLCLTSAYIDGQSRSLNAISLPGQLGGLTLAPGLYTNSSTSGISGTGANGILTLDAQGNANAVWIFQMGSTLTTDPATSIVLAGGASAKNIFWIVGTSATLGTTSVFYGNILADQSITLNTGAVLNGRALTRIAAVSLDASTITKP